MDEERSAFVSERIVDVLRDEFGLGELGVGIMQKWMRKMAADDPEEKLKRVRDWLIGAFNRKSASVAIKDDSISKWQKGCPDIVPNLTARPFWNFSPTDELYYFLQRLSENTDVIRNELLATKGKKVFQPYRAPTWTNPSRKAKDGLGSLAHDSGDWNVLYLLLHNVDFTENSQLFPETMKVLRGDVNADMRCNNETIGSKQGCRPRLYRHVFFSALSPGTHITKHHGPTNKKLRIHLPLIVPDNPENSSDTSGCSGIRVGDQTKTFKFGECIVFDDSFEHEAWNNHPSEKRVCLIVDIWHPDLSDQEVTLLNFLEKAKMNKAKCICSRQSEQVDRQNSERPSENENNDDVEEDIGDNFYALLERTRKELSIALID